jgi:hypothetical protein
VNLYLHSHSMNYQICPVVCHFDAFRDMETSNGRIKVVGITGSKPTSYFVLVTANSLLEHKNISFNLPPMDFLATTLH